MELVIYALGGGLGHLTRATALARGLERRGHTALILTNSPFAGVITDSVELLALPRDLDRDGVTARVHGELASRHLDALVVDTFPRGLAGELAGVMPSLDTPAVLVHRDISPRYIERFELERFAAHYELLLVPGERAPLASAPNARWTRPWLVRDADELLSREAARERLGTAGDEPLVVVVGSGKDAEIDEAERLRDALDRELSGEASVRLVSPRASGGSHWPLLELHRGIDVVVGAGGYNTVNECRATGTPLVAMARKRLYDRQEHRLDASEHVRDVAGIAPRVRDALARWSEHRGSPSYANGVGEAVRAIETVARGA